MAKNPRQFSLWQLLKCILIAALITRAILPFIRDYEAISANPEIAAVVFLLVFLIQSPILFLPMFIDWLLGYKPPKAKLPKADPHKANQAKFDKLRSPDDLPEQESNNWVADSIPSKADASGELHSTPGNRYNARLT